MAEGAVATPAAPAAAAAPSPAPAPPPAPPAAAPISPAAEPQAAPGAQPAPGQGEQPPAAPAAPAGPVEPKQEDFPGDVESFLRAHNAWERGDVPGQEPKPAPAEGAEAKSPEEQPKPAEEPKPAEPVESVTPESLNGFLQNDAALKAALDANPTAKNAVFGMARKLAQYEPIGQLFAGSIEAAKFAERSAGTMVDVRSGFLEAIDTGDVSGAYERFAEEFVERDKDGNPLKDEGGNPVYGSDFHMLNDYIVDTYFDVEIADHQQLIQADKFASDEEREAADMALQAYQYLKKYKAGEATAKPDLSKLDPATREYYERKEREIAEREAKLNGADKQQTAAQRQQERTNYEQDVARSVGGTVGQRLMRMIADDAKNGVFIPSYIMDAKDPETGISLFAKNLLDRFEEATYGRFDKATGKVVGGVAAIRNEARTLARRSPSPQAKQDRVDFALRLIDQHLPEIYQRERRSIQNKARADAERSAPGQRSAAELTEREPRGGSAPQGPKPVTAEEAMQKAYAEVDQKYPDLWGAERLEKALQIKNRMMGTGY